MSGTPITHSPDGAPSNILSDLRASSDTTPSGPTGPELSGLPSRSVRRVNTQTLVLALVLTASAASLYMMRKQGMGAGIKFNTTQVKIDADIDNLHAPTTAVQQRILADLERGTEPQQLALEKLHKNPFVLPETEGSSSPTEPAVNPRLQREAEIVAALGGIQLNGVMQGPVPLARVNNKLVRVGDRVEKIFLVAQIHDRSIDLIADGQTYTLNMGEASANPTRPNPRAPAAPPRR